MIAIITGISGQDGAYLAKLLLEKGYTVVGLVRANNSALSKLRYLKIEDSVIIKECDLLDITQTIKIIQQYQPTEIYNLAAQSSVALSFEQPIATIQFNINSVLHILEAIRIVNPKIKFYQASSSEMYGKVQNLPITENTVFHPLSPYAISKVAAHQLTINYRESYGLYTCCGILFNHESYLRSNNFIIKKLIRGALAIQRGQLDVLEFGNLNIKRDFGYSPNYVEAMWLMMQQQNAEDFIICSGKSLLLSDIVYFVFDHLHLDRSKVKINQSFMRPTDIEDIYGDNTKAIATLNWNVNDNFFDILESLIKEESENFKNA